MPAIDSVHTYALTIGGVLFLRHALLRAFGQRLTDIPAARQTVIDCPSRDACFLRPLRDCHGASVELDNLALGDGRGKGNVNRPAVSVKPQRESSPWNVQDFSPFGNGQFLPIKFDKPCVPFVSGLLLTSCPSTVLGKVAQVIVNSIQRILRPRRHPHVVKKCFKRLAPLFAHMNAAFAIVPLGHTTAVRAATDHSAPCLQLFLHFECVTPVGMSELSHPLLSSAAAPLRRACLETVAGNDTRCTAFTSTVPHLTRTDSNQAIHCPEAEFHSSQVFHGQPVDSGWGWRLEFHPNYSTSQRDSRISFAGRLA